MASDASSRLQVLHATATGMRDRAEREGRALSEDELIVVDQLLDGCESAGAEIGQNSMQPRVVQPFSSASFGGAALGSRGAASFTARTFGSVRATRTPFQSAGDFLRVAAVSNLMDARFRNAAAGQSEEVGEEGGYAVPEQFSARLLDMAAERSIFLQRANVVPAISNQLVLPQWEADHTGGKRGALTGVWMAEAGAASTQKAKMLPVTIRLNKVGTWLSITSEMNEDAPATARQIENLAANAIAAAVDIACVTGNGVGKPLGITLAPATIAQAAEASQTADTVWPENLVRMLSRLNPGSFSRAVWLVHPTCIPSLFLLTVKVKNVAGAENVGGYAPPWFQVLADGTMTLLGRPVIPTDACSVVGDVGDIVLADLDEYLLPMRNSLRVEQSLGPGWATDEISIRVVLRVGGCPQPAVPTKLNDGTNTTSSFVTLAAR